MWISLEDRYEAIKFECYGDSTYGFDFGNNVTLSIPEDTMTQMIRAILEYDIASGELKTREHDKAQMRRMAEVMERWHGLRESMEYRRQLEDELEEEMANEDLSSSTVSH